MRTMRTASCQRDAMSDAATAVTRDLISSLPPDGEGVVLCFGWSAAVPHIADEIPASYEIVVYDPDGTAAEIPERVRMITADDFSFLSDYRFRVANGQFKVIRHNPTIARHARAFDTFLKQLEEEMVLARVNTTTAIGMGHHFIDAYFDNIPALLTHPGVASLAGLFPGWAAFVIGPGPSLAYSTEALRVARIHRTITVAVDAALPYLRAQGIVPDFIVGIDPLPENMRFYGGMEYWRSAALVALAQYTPEVIRTYRGPLFMCDQPGNAAHAWLAHYWNPKGTIEAFGGSVSHLAFSLADHVGCTSIGLVGQDLCWQDDYYAPGTWDTIHGREIAQPGAGARMPARNNLGQTVWTNGILTLFLTSWKRRFMRVTECNGQHIYQCSRGGLSIPGACDLDPMAFLEELCTLKNVRDNQTAHVRELHRYAADKTVAADYSLLRAEIDAAIGLLQERENISRRILKLLDRERLHRHNLGRRAQIIKDVERLNARVPHPILNLVAAYSYGIELYLASEATRRIDDIEHPEKQLREQLARAEKYYMQLKTSITGLLRALRSLSRRLAHTGH